MNKFVMTTAATALLVGAVIGTVQTADAATKKYTVTVKYVGDDKKTLKTVKKTVKAGTKYTLAKLSTKDKAVHNYAYKSGSKTVKVTKSASYTVNYKRTAYDVKFITKKSDQSKTSTVTKTVKKGATLKYTAPKLSWYTNTSAKTYTVKPKKDTSYTLNYKRQFKFVINFVDVHGNTIRDRTYSNHTPIPSQTVTVLDGASLNVPLPDNSGTLAGWNISAFGQYGWNDDPGIQKVAYRTASGYTDEIETTSDDIAVVSGNQLISSKLTMSEWPDLYERLLQDGTVVVNVNYAPNQTYWQKQFYAQSDSTVNKALANSGISGLTGAYATVIKNLKNMLHAQMDWDLAQDKNNDNKSFLDTIDQTSGSWNYVIKAWSESGVTIKKLDKATTITSNDEDWRIDQDMIGYGPRYHIFVGLDYGENYYSPAWSDVYGGLDLESVKAYFTVTTTDGTYFIVQDSEGQVGLAKKANSSMADTDYYAE